MAAREVRIGDRTYPIARFKGFKAVRAGRIVQQLSDQYPVILDAMAEFTRNYEAKNTVRITRAMAHLPRFQALGLTDQDFDGREYIELPQAPSGEERLFAVFHKVMTIFEQQLMELLALIVAPNSELRRADSEDRVDQYLADLGKELLFEGDLDELAMLLVEAREVIEEQFTGKLERLRLLWAIREGVQQVQGEAQPVTDLSDLPKNPPRETTIQNGTRLDSSTVSPPPTDGIANELSTASTG